MIKKFLKNKNSIENKKNVMILTSNRKVVLEDFSFQVDIMGVVENAVTLEHPGTFDRKILLISILDDAVANVIFR